jgi:hypothetical protein
MYTPTSTFPMKYWKDIAKDNYDNYMEIKEAPDQGAFHILR